MSLESPRIDWQYSGKPDYSFGTGATSAERMLGSAGAVVAALPYLYWYMTGGLAWAGWQYVLAALLAVDVGGGVVCNSLNSCKRFYHAPLQPEDTRLTQILKNHLIFTLFHIHPILIGLAFGTGLAYGVFWYIALLAATATVMRVPLYLRRPTAIFTILLVLLIQTVLLPAPDGFAWMLPALFLKIVYGHLVREEPYRPHEVPVQAEAEVSVT